jgi:carbamoyl-phosphate synthase large subunit
LRILLTGAGGPSTEAVLKLWSPKHELFFADAKIDSITPQVSSDKKLFVPYANDKQFLQSIIDLTTKLQIDILISQVDEELPLLAGNKERFNPTLLLVPDENFINLFLDKLQSGIKMNENRILEPGTKVLNNESKFEGLPVIFKPCFGRGSRSIFSVDTQKEFDALKNYLLTQEEIFITQQKIQGDEYSVQVLANSNGILKGITPILIKGKRGSTTSGVVSNNREVIKACLDFHQVFKTSGTYNIQLMLKGAQAYIFEVNPRVSTTMCVSLFGGSDPVDIYLDSGTEENIKYVSEGTKLQRHWNHTFSLNVNLFHK